MKTPEDKAREYLQPIWNDADRRYGGYWAENGPQITYDAFLRGYHLAKREEKEQWDAAHERMVAEYQTNSPKNSNSSDDSDTPDLQEQIEALQQYMTVAQRKIMALQANVEFLLYHNKEKIGESETIRRMQQAMQGFGRNND